MQNLEFKLQISKTYCILLAIVFLMSGIIVIVLPAPVWLRAILLAALFGYALHTFWRYALLKSELSILGLKKLEAKHWQLTTNKGVVEAELRGDSTVTTLVSVLRFDLPGRKLPIVSIIFRDNLGADVYRRLIGMVRTS
jgi:hypothetical protein